MAVSLKIIEFNVQEPVRVIRTGPGNEPENLLEERFVARDSQGTVVSETVLFFGFEEKFLEDRVVQIRRAHDKSGVVGSHADCHVSCGYIGRCASGGHACLVAPAP